MTRNVKSHLQTVGTILGIVVVIAIILTLPLLALSVGVVMAAVMIYCSLYFSFNGPYEN